MEQALRGAQPLCCMRRGRVAQHAVPRLMDNGWWHVEGRCGICVAAVVETFRYKEFEPGDSVVIPGNLVRGTIEQVHGTRGTKRRWLVVSHPDWEEPEKYSYRSDGRWHRAGSHRNRNDVVWIGH
jgi:hypothetical protein